LLPGQKAENATKRIVLTDRAVRAAKPHENGKAYYIADAYVPGLLLCVQPTGTKSWIALPRLFRKQIKLTFGRFPDKLVAAARDAALANLRDVAAGKDPRDAKARERAALADSFETVAGEFISRHVAGLKSATPCGAIIRNELIPAIGRKPIAQVTRRDIVEIVERIVDSGRPEMARKTFLVASARSLRPRIQPVPRYQNQRACWQGDPTRSNVE
jgi:hypothetical protein